MPDQAAVVETDQGPVIIIVPKPREAFPWEDQGQDGSDLTPYQRGPLKKMKPSHYSNLESTGTIPEGVGNANDLPTERPDPPFTQPPTDGTLPEPVFEASIQSDGISETAPAGTIAGGVVVEGGEEPFAYTLLSGTTTFTIDAETGDLITNDVTAAGDYAVTVLVDEAGGGSTTATGVITILP